MKKIYTVIICAIMLLVITGCTDTDEVIASSISGKSFVYERGGMSGIEGDTFIISLLEDGSFMYSEGFASSHFSYPMYCSWEVSDGCVILTENDSDRPNRVNYFKVDNGNLIYIADKSDNFIYTDLKNGDMFLYAKGLIEGEQ